MAQTPKLKLNTKEFNRKFSDQITEETANWQTIDTILFNLINKNKAMPPSVDGKNMDDIKETGFYRGYNMTNSYRDGSISTFIVIAYADNWIIQIQLLLATVNGRPTIAARTYVGGINLWTQWYELAFK